ncbi:hypothetical protein [Aliiroseovarius crassostreae]|uniref:hypothetical protein n=1 Tax=Aliiroseovarius crassostreae TaxID=154981 RepID=UPI00220FF353|nr:hypothetical protein [Aliiroseovarius crassostreae]UWQ05931.1 hypothetical protein K3X22_05740 [Aliiroseovarius crassostreae]
MTNENVIPYATITDHLADESATHFAFASIEETHKAEAALEAMPGCNFDRTRRAEVGDERMLNGLNRLCGGKISTAEDVKTLLAA